ncbi:MAG: tRNA lysidine(34) synthetase TilS [Chitinispirillaceae bacterium]
MTPPNISDHLRSFWKQLKPTTSVLVGLSGGADSVALVHLLHLYKKELGISRIAAAHVNHSLRGEESDVDEEFVRTLCQKLQIELFTTKLDRTGLKESGIEEWARRERYTFFHQMKNVHKFDYIATAHTANDQAETLIMRMMRGAGIRGMRGILSVRQDGVIRPLINVQRRELLEWLESQTQPFRTDSSNFDPAFRRNWVRQEIIPKLVSQEPSAIANMVATARRMSEIWELLSEKIMLWISSNVVKTDEFSFWVSKEGLIQETIASEALMTIFDEYEISLGQTHLERILASRTLTHGENLLPKLWRFYPARDRIFFTRADCHRKKIDCELRRTGRTFCRQAGILFHSEEFQGKPENISDDNKRACIDVSEQELPLRCRNSRKGDRFWPLGASKEMDLEHFLKKQGIPAKIREMSSVVVSAQDNIVWIPGVRISHHFRIKPDTERFFEISSDFGRKSDA